MNRNSKVRSYAALFIGLIVILLAPFITECLFDLHYFQVHVNLLSQRETFGKTFHLAGFLLAEYGLIGYAIGLLKEDHK